MQQPSHSLTVKSLAGVLRVLETSCEVRQAFDPASGNAIPKPCQSKAIWDTGATASVVTQSVVDACSLKATGMVQVHGVSGAHVSETYLVDIRLPNGVVIHQVKVTKGILPTGTNVLIGMDVISLGDFAVTNMGGKTVFSFRIPSITHIDFVQEHNAAALSMSHGGTSANRPAKQKKFGKNKKHK